MSSGQKDTKLIEFGISSIQSLIPIDTESCREIINYSLNLGNDKLISDHLLDILGVNSEALSFIEKFIALKQESETTPKPVWKPSEVEKSSHKQDQSKVSNIKHNKSSVTTSQLLDKRSPVSVPVPTPSKTAKNKKLRNLNNLKDIEAAINEIESTQESTISSTGGIRVCNCLATRHPLFELAPNCLNCGKIICSKEGLQPCSFCGTPLLNSDETKSILNALESERDVLLKRNGGETKDDPKTKPHSKPKKIVVSVNKGENLWKAQERAFKMAEDEFKKSKQAKEEEKIEAELNRIESIDSIDPDLQKATERLETLLDFQATGAERTKIIDNAADFDMPTASGTMWLSPMERALQLKVWQKELKNQEAKKNERTGRGDKSVEMVIKDGKVTMVEKYRTPKENDSNELIELHEGIKKHKQQAEKSNWTYWDYEKDKEKWDKPVYVGVNSVSTGSTELPKSRVQFQNPTNSEELVIALP
ncbi:putative zinc finger motif, C2HC5-type-domain-containing protein [Scheffersomyces amazonensis]|uniref:putative zinc finger motif, C2HC5-type-domain-containing protein n=1 Tax=Scheffersomyces amazonensis TaxID=1078765 RepID=UPI00315CF906